MRECSIKKVNVILFFLWIGSINYVHAVKLPKEQNSYFNIQLGISTKKLTSELLRNKRPKKRDLQRAAATKNLQELKDGTLLIRLKTSDLLINQLVSVGKLKEAELVREKQKFENKNIIYAFKAEYSFSKILFFYSSNSNNIRNRNFSGIFLNENLVVDSSITIDITKEIFIAEFGTIEPDTATYYLEGKDVRGMKSNSKQKYVGPNFGFSALVIRNKNFIQLHSPFPYYVKFNPFKDEPYSGAVNRLNNRLVNHYYEYVGRFINK